jgi:methoxymalonate biosynthesis acyl carrier protein
MLGAMNAAPRTSQAIGDELERFIRTHFAVDDDDDLFTRDVNLWEEGYVDSTGVVEVLAHIEATWQLQVPDELLFDPAFVTITGMARLLGELEVEDAA